MTPLHTETVTNADQWNTILRSLPFAHILQTWEWGDFKARTTGWQPERLLFWDNQHHLIAAASLLTRRIGPLRVIYIPKGPVFASENADYYPVVLIELAKIARRRRAIWLKIDPDIVIGTGLPSESLDSETQPNKPNPLGEALREALHQKHWRLSSDQVQFANSLTLDLTQSEETLLANMNQTTRRKIRQSDKQGVQVRSAHTTDDFQTLYRLYEMTGQRQGFIVRPFQYYLDLWQTFIQRGIGHALIAEWEGQPIAGIVLFHFGRKAWYFYAMSSNEHRDKQPTFALQWEAIRWAKGQGYTTYDFWGAPNTFREDDPMWGVYQAKRGFGGQVVRHIGAWDFAPYPPLYWGYIHVMPRILNWLRRRHTSQADIQSED